ncbi:hypothetical protein HN873_017727 [Arachis hypogaea]
MAYNNSLLLIVTLSSLLLSGHAYRYTGMSIWFTNPAPAPAPGPVTAEPTNPVNDFFSGLNENLNLDLGLNLEGDAKSKAQQIADFCNGIQNPDFCAETIAPFVKGKFDPIKALETQMNAALNHSLEVVAEIAKSLKDHATPKKAMAALSICKECYDNAVDAINESLELVNQDNVIDAYYRFSSAASYRGTCDDAFVESPGAINPISKEAINAASQFISKSLVIFDASINNQNNFLF